MIFLKAICLEAEVCSTQGFEGDVEMSLPAARVSNSWEADFAWEGQRHLIRTLSAPEKYLTPGMNAGCG